MFKKMVMAKVLTNTKTTETEKTVGTLYRIYEFGHWVYCAKQKSHGLYSYPWYHLSAEVRAGKSEH